MGEVVCFGLGGDYGVSKGVILVMGYDCFAFIDVFGDVAISVIEGVVAHWSTGGWNFCDG